MTPMRRGGQDRLGHQDHSCLTTFTSHLQAVSCTPLLRSRLDTRAATDLLIEMRMCVA